MSDTNISKAIQYIGVDDTTLDLFESQYIVPNGVSYNSYVILDEKTAVMDTVDARKTEEWFANLEQALAGRTVDYLIISHLEPDHSSNIKKLADKYPSATLVLSAKAKAMLPQFFDIDNLEERTLAVKEGDTLNLGEHELTFIMAPMVHWPEVMVTYDESEKVLFSADAFGTFGALSGNLFADEVDFDRDWIDDARRYYINIVGKYGSMTMNLLKKASALDIRMICPLHGPIWRENLGYFIEKHSIWASYESEKKGALIIYSSIYGNTENAAMVLSQMIGDKGVKDIRAYDASVTDVSYLVAECFKYSTIVFVSPTYNAEIFPKMESLLLELKAHAFQNKDVAVVESGTWALSSGKKMSELLGAMKSIRMLAPVFSFKSSLKESDLPLLEELADKVSESALN